MKGPAYFSQDSEDDCREKAERCFVDGSARRLFPQEHLSGRGRIVRAKRQHQRGDDLESRADEQEPGDEPAESGEEQLACL